MGGGLFSKTEVTQDMSSDTGSQEIVPSVYAVEKQIEGFTYNPVVSILTTSISEKPTSDTFNQVILGEFIDSVTSVEISAPNSTGASVNLISKTFSQLNLSIVTNAVIQTYTLTFKKGENVLGTLDFNTANLTLIIPSLVGSGQSLWQQPTPLPANNEVTLDDGYFEAEQNNGEGWNNHAYYGNFTGAFNKVVHEMTHNNDTNAYCYIKFDNTNNVGTTGNPRIYIQNGNTLLVYSNTGAQISTGAISNGDVINVEFTSTSMRVLINGELRVENNADYSIAMQGSFVTFTSFRFTILSNIQTKLIE